LIIEESVVREAVVDGGRTDGLGSDTEDGIRTRRWAARASGPNRGRRATEMYMLVEKMLQRCYVTAVDTVVQSELVLKPSAVSESSAF
jgi:hypothetical protein